MDDSNRNNISLGNAFGDEEKSGHAPGPWRVDKDNLNVYANGMIAQTFGHWHTGERQANARLIAASPDLLIGCIRALGELVCIEEKMEDKNSKDALKIKVAMTILRSAVSKATRGE